MRIHKSFTREKGGTNTLGTDGLPGVAPTFKATIDVDNALIAPFANTSGNPVMRIAVGYAGPPAAIALSAQVWQYDDLTELWYESGAPINITPNRLTFFDVAALCEPSSIYPSRPSAGSILAALVVQGGATPDGIYTFSMGACLSVL